MSSKQITQLAIGLCVIILLAVEVHSFINPELGDTISEVMFGIFDQYPILLYICGIITGHIVWPLTTGAMKYLRGRK